MNNTQSALPQCVRFWDNQRNVNLNIIVKGEKLGNSHNSVNETRVYNNNNNYYYYGIFENVNIVYTSS